MSRIARAKFLASSAALAALGTPFAIRAQTLEPIRIAAVPTDDMTPIYFAIKNGSYAKAGLAVEVVAATSGSASTAAIVAGAYELGKASPVASLLAHLRGLPLTIVANGAVWNPKSPFNLVIVAADSPMKTPADCNNKIASAPGLNDASQLAVLLWIDKNGGDSKTVKWVEFPNSAGAAAVAEHRVDLTTLNEPQLTAALEGGKVRALGDAFSSIAEHWAASVYIARPDWAAKHVDAIKRWSRITYEAAGYTNAHKAETVALMSEITKIPTGVFQKMARIEGTTGPDPALLQPVIELAARYKVIPASFAARDMYFSS